MGVCTHTGPGQFLGGSILPPLVTNSNTSWLLRLGYGMYPSEKISHSKTPNDLQESNQTVDNCRWGVRASESVSVTESYHVSVFDVKMPSMKASGGIHLTGSMALPPFL